MKLTVLEEGPKKMIFELEGEGHTFCNALRAKLLEVSGVHLAVYNIDHPLTGKPKMMLETTSIKPREALKKAAEALKKEFRDLEKEAGKI